MALDRQIQSSGRRSKFFRVPLMRWHKWIGLASALIVVVMAITGVLLNHSLSLNLQDTQIGSPFAGYRSAPEQLSSYQVPQGWITWVDDQLFLNAALVDEPVGQIVGVTSIQDIIAAATEDQILLMTTDGFLIERLPGHSLPGRISAMGQAEGAGFLVNTEKGMFLSDSDFTEWIPAELDVVWSEASSLPNDLYQAIAQTMSDKPNSLDRILLNVHTGRFLGSWGPYLFDIAAVAMLFLAFSGVTHSLRLSRHRKSNKNRIL